MDYNTGFLAVRKEVIGAFILGSTISYWFNKRYMINKYKQQIELDTKRYMINKYKQQIELDLARARASHEHAIRIIQARHEVSKPSKPSIRIVRSDPAEEVFDVEAEELPDVESEERNTDEPYVISHDEYTGDEVDFGKVTLTYYVNDDILFGEDAIPIMDVDLLIGDKNLKRFGHGSNDKNVVYVRNEDAQTDYKITLSTTENYASEVYGYIEHNDKPRKVHKFRREEE